MINITFEQMVTHPIFWLILCFVYAVTILYFCTICYADGINTVRQEAINKGFAKKENGVFSWKQHPPYLH